jgi:hypothetical protein
VTANTGSLTNASQNGSLGLNIANNGSGATTVTDLAGNALSTTLPLSGAVYTIDRLAPPAPSITSGPAQNSTVASSSATFGFSDTEPGVAYLCRLDAGSYAACANPATFSGLADGSHTVTVEATDAAGNVSGPSASRTWTVDTTPPPKPGITGPNSNSPSTAATFTFSDTEAGVTYVCNLDGSAYGSCSNPKTFTLLSPGTHEVDVEAVDTVGNVSTNNGWKWTISGSSGSGMPFTITSTASGPLLPGGPVISLNLKLTNPNSVPIYVTSLTVSLASVTPLTGKTCASTNFNLPTQWAGGYPLTIPANGSKSLSDFTADQSQWPHLTMKETGANQDGCKNATVNFTYSGQAQS